MAVSPYCRPYTAEEIRQIADRIDQLVKRGRIVRLRPETAWLVEQAGIGGAAVESLQTMSNGP